MPSHSWSFLCPSLALSLLEATRVFSLSLVFQNSPMWTFFIHDTRALRRPFTFQIYKLQLWKCFLSYLRIFSSFFLSILMISCAVFHTDTLIFSCFSFFVYFLRFSWLCLLVLLLEFCFWWPYFSFLKLFLLYCSLFRALPCVMNAIFSLFPLKTLIVFFWLFSSAPCKVSLTLEVLSSRHHVYWFTFLSGIFEDFLKCLVFLGYKFIIKIKGRI